MKIRQIALNASLSLSLIGAVACTSKQVVEPETNMENETVDVRSAFLQMGELEQAATIQQALNNHGAQLKVDGVVGPRTVTAIRSFQKKNNLPVSGITDEATLTALGLY